MSGEPNQMIQFFLPMVFFLGVFYFMIMRPQQKKQKEHEDLLSKIDKNDEVITSGGIHATVVGVNDKTAMVRIADNVKIEIDKSAILHVTKSRQA